MESVKNAFLKDLLSLGTGLFLWWLVKPPTEYLVGLVPLLVLVALPGNIATYGADAGSTASRILLFSGPLLRLLNIFGLFLAFRDNPVEYYSSLGSATFGTSAYNALLSYTRQSRVWLGAWIILGVAFNPVFSLHYSRYVWLALDGVAAVALVAFTIQRPERSSGNLERVGLSFAYWPLATGAFVIMIVPLFAIMLLREAGALLFLAGSLVFAYHMAGERIE